MKPKLFLTLLPLTLACTPATARTPPPTEKVVNPSFDEAGGSLQGWAVRGEEYARARAVKEPVVSAPGALELEAKGPGSSGERSFMIYQVLDPAAFRGRRVRFGAQVRTAGGAVNITLYTPEKFANDFFDNLQSGGYKPRAAALEVPANASFLSFGIQIFGPAGGKAWVDDAFVTLEDGGGKERPQAAAPAPAAATSDQASVKIDATQSEGRVSPLAFGMHTEWTERGNGLVGESGELRRDVLEALIPLRIPLFRFPGGILADYYDWSKGIGPPASRPAILNVFTGKPEPPLFGTPEFVELLRATGGFGMITANYGTGTPEQAAAWASDLKARGAPVPFWEVGNEIYLADPARDQPNGRAIAKPPEGYAADYPKFRDAIRAVIPDAKVGLVAYVDSGAFPIVPSANREWSARMLANLHSPADFISTHNAYAPVIVDDSVRFATPEARGRVYRALYAAPGQIVENLRALASLLDQSERGQGLPIAITEFGPLFGQTRDPDLHAAYVDQSRTMAAALFVASLLDTLLGEPRVVIACYTNPIHKWYGSLLTDTPQGLVRTPTYYVYELFRARFEARLVRASVTSPGFDAPGVGLVKAQPSVPDLLARASLSEDGKRLTVMLVNRSLDRALTTQVEIKGFTPTRADCQVLSAPPNAVNGPGLTSSTTAGQAIVPAALRCDPAGTMTLAIPPSAVVSLLVEGQG